MISSIIYYIIDVKNKEEVINGSFNQQTGFKKKTGDVNFKMKYKKEITAIQDRLIDIIRPENSVLLLNGGCTGDNRYLFEDVRDLRLYGVPIILPNTFTVNNNMNYYEVCAEILRQIELYQHPVKKWFKDHVDTLIISALSVAATIISIVSIFKK